MLWAPETDTTSAIADLCLLSDPWWTSFSNCNVTPIQSVPFGGDTGLRDIPWVQAEHVKPRGFSIVGHQFFGNRPLPVAGVFPHGEQAKVLWTFDQPLAAFTMTATRLGVDSIEPVPITTGATYGNAAQWPSIIALPAAGCWRADLAATTVDGDSFTGQVTFVVVE